MVYEDISSDQKNLKVKLPLTKGYQASVLDRIFSFVLDYLILSPVVSFLILIFFQKEISVWKENSFSPELQAVFILLGIVYILLFSFMQSFFIYFWQATPGQYFLKLKIHNENSTEFLFFRILLRQVGFWLSILFVGFPWLSILSHPQQKTFYDKLSELQVLSGKSQQNYFTFELETKYWQAFVTTFLIFFTVLGIAVGWQQHQKIKLAAYTFEKMKNENFFCEELKSVQITDRLQTVIALNLVSQISDTCVDKEADFVLWKSDNEELRSLAYYAKSLTENESDAEEKYLNQACQIQQNTFLGCQLAQAFLSHNILAFYQKLKTTTAAPTLLTSTLRYELGQAINQIADGKVNFEQLKKFDTQVLVKKYILSEILNRSDKENPQKRSIATEENSENKISDEDVAYAQKLIQEM